MNSNINNTINSNDNIIEHPYKEIKKYWSTEEASQNISLEEQFYFCIRKDIYICNMYLKLKIS